MPTQRPKVGRDPDIAAAVLCLASPHARSITGHHLVVNGGTSTHIPGIAGALAQPSLRITVRLRPGA